MTVTPPQPPPGLRGAVGKPRGFHQLLVLSLTFLAYASFHASRKPPSIVKAVLTGSVNQTLATDAAANSAPFSAAGRDSVRSATDGTGWPPFNGPEGPHRLGELDLSFLLAYAVGMYFAGHFGDRVDLRIFLTIGMVGSGTFVILFGLGYFLDLHSFTAFVIIQIFCGLFQSIGWPCVVAVVGNWCGQAKRGLIMGLWNSHTSVGNIIGSVLASYMLGLGWGWSFLAPGFLILIAAVLIYFFLAVSPAKMGLAMSENVAETNVEGAMLVGLGDVVDGNGGALVEAGEDAALVRSENVDGGGGWALVGTGEDAALVGSENVDGDGRALLRTGENEDAVSIGFVNAWRLPNVASYALCLFFSKLVAYTFLYWLPFYLQHTKIGGRQLSHKQAGMLSTVFDLGGVLGGISAGYISDKIEARGVTAIAFLLLSIPTLIVYLLYGSISMFANGMLMCASGLFVNGPYSLITTAVAADIGTESAIRGNAQALATVTAIIDGTGSVGAALGPLLTGYISTRGWKNVFAMLISAIIIAACLLIRVVKKEIRGKWADNRWLWLNCINW